MTNESGVLVAYHHHEELKKKVGYLQRNETDYSMDNELEGDI